MPYRLTNSGAIVDASGNVAYESCALEGLSPKAKRRIVQIENDAEHNGLEIEFEKDVLPVLIREGLDAEAARPAPAGSEESEAADEDTFTQHYRISELDHAPADEEDAR